MRITKTRQQRDRTINPNPPICRSKELTLTYIRVLDCATDQELKIIQRYGLTYEEAGEVSQLSAGQYSAGYFYQPDFHMFTDLSVNLCESPEWWCTVEQSEYPAIYTPSDSEYAFIDTPTWDTQASWSIVPNDGTGPFFNAIGIYEEGWVCGFASGTLFHFACPLTTEYDTADWTLYDADSNIIANDQVVFLPLPVPVCREGTRAAIVAAGWQILSGPYPSEAACQGSCGT